MVLAESIASEEWELGKTASRLGFGGGDALLGVPKAHLGSGQHQDRLLDEGLAGQAPGLGPAAQLLLFNGGPAAQASGTAFAHHIDETGDALAAAAAVPELPFEAIELQAFTQGDLAEVLAGVALHIPALTNEANDGHDGGNGISAF